MSSQETRSRILKAALKIFSTHGYSGATTRSIAETARVNEVTLFRHFGSKESLFSEVIKTYSAIPYIEQIRKNKQQSFEKRLRSLAHHVIGILNERKNLISIMLSEGSRQTKHANVILNSGPAQVLRTLTDWFREEMKRRPMKKIQPEYAARAFMGMFFSYLILQKVLPGDEFFPIDEERMIDSFIDIFLYGIQEKRTPS